MSNKRMHMDMDVQESASSQRLARRPSSKGNDLKFGSFHNPNANEPEPSSGRRTSKTTDGAEGADSDASSDQAGRSRKKAEPVKSACVQCQKRKTKCSGQRPVCRFCGDRNLEW